MTLKLSARNLVSYKNVLKVEDERICPICGDEAPPGETHHAHYGGICCFSCRAFFRRAQQRKKSTPYRCKRSEAGNCVLLPKSKAMCKKCRLEKCLAVGMDPYWVLTDDEKRIRFKNFFKKKDEQAASRGTLAGEEGSSAASARDSASPNTNRTRNRKNRVKANLQCVRQPRMILPKPQEDGGTVAVQMEEVAPPSSSTNISEAPPLLESTSRVTNEHCSKKRKDCEAKTFPVTPSIPHGSKVICLSPERMALPEVQQALQFLCGANDPKMDSLVSPSVSSSPVVIIVPASTRVGEDEKQVALLGTSFPSMPPKIETSMRDPICEELTLVLDSYALTAGKMIPSSDSALCLIQSHLKSRPFCTSSLVSQLSLIASMMTEFATTQEDFKNLCTEDQTVLLRNNIPLYLQYVLGRYFSAANGLEQVNWILEGQLSVDSLDFLKNLCHISLKEYQVATGFFSSWDVAELYSHYCENLGAFYPLPQYCNGLIAKLVLYYSNGLMYKSFKDPQKILALFRKSKKQLGACLSFFDRSVFVITKDSIDPFFHTLIRMKGIFESCKVKTAQPLVSESFKRQMSLQFKETEDSWVRARFTEFSHQFKSVLPIKEYLDDALNLLLKNKPVSSSFGLNYMLTIRERMRRVFRMHDEFNSLPDAQQCTLLKNNLRHAIALQTSRINIFKSGKDQTREAFGILTDDDRTWEEHVKGLALEQARPAYIIDSRVHHGKFDENAIRLFKESLRDVSTLCSDPDVYKLIVLLTLFDTEGIPDEKKYLNVIKLRQVYLKILQRKLKTMHNSFIDGAAFRHGMNKIKVLSFLFDTIYNCEEQMES